MQDDGFNKMCKYKCTLLNLKYTDAITQLQMQNLYNQYYDQQIQDNRRTQTRSIVTANHLDKILEVVVNLQINRPC